jgi:release factor glutamine methyltransferase
MMRLRLPSLPGRLRHPALPLSAEQCPTVEDCRACGALLLEQAGIETAGLDAECLLAEALTWPRWRLLIEPRRRLGAEEFARYLRLLQRREEREPLAYLLGRREFWSLQIAVSPGVLIPRPETETLVETALAARREMAASPGARVDAQTIVELCTGSGAVAIALAHELPDVLMIATDKSWRALRVAHANAEAHGTAERIRFLRGDLWRALNGHALAPVDLIVANPPYVPSGVVDGLMPEVQWEPRSALDGGTDGLDILREIIIGAPPRLRTGGVLVLEIGSDQAAAVLRLLDETHAFAPGQVRQDLAGRDRVVMARSLPDRANEKWKTDN